MSALAAISRMTVHARCLSHRVLGNVSGDVVKTLGLLEKSAVFKKRWGAMVTQKKPMGDDGVLVRSSKKFSLLAVADGVGSLPNSRACVQMVCRYLEKLELNATLTPDVMLDELNRCRSSFPSDGAAALLVATLNRGVVQGVAIGDVQGLVADPQSGEIVFATHPDYTPSLVTQAVSLNRLSPDPVIFRFEMCPGQMFFAFTDGYGDAFKQKAFIAVSKYIRQHGVEATLSHLDALVGLLFEGGADSSGMMVADMRRLALELGVSQDIRSKIKPDDRSIFVYEN